MARVQGFARRHRSNLLALAVCVFAAGLGVPSASALELTGVLLLPVTLEGNLVGPVWHTASGAEGRPLGLAISLPTGVRQAPLLNGENGEVDVSLLNVVDIAAFWQSLEDEFPPAMVMNLYFNGDNLTPGIGAIIASNAEPSAFLMNRSPQTVSLHLADVENRPALLFDDGTLRGTLTAAFFFSSTGLASPWRTSLFENLDRVGVDNFAPDGLADGVFVFELTVGPSPTPPAPLPARPRVQAAPVAVPVARVGEDSWVGPTPNGPLPGPSTPMPTPAPEVSGSQRAPTPARTVELDSTPMTSTTGSATAGTAVPSTPTPVLTRSRSATPRTPTPKGGATDETPAAGTTEKGLRDGSPG